MAPANCNRRTWRKEMKKIQRKRRRRRAAQERDKAFAEEEADPSHKEWHEQQLRLGEFERLAAEQIRQEEEEAWLRRELIAQRQFRLDKQKRDAEEAVRESIRLQQQKELEEREAERRKRREEKERLVAEAAAEFERIMQLMNDYLDGRLNEETPPELKRFTDTKPGKNLCEFFERTNCCRFGLPCVFNHRRPLLSSIIVVQHFFSHPLLDQVRHKEYETADADLEMNERDLRVDYDTFFKDVLPELEKFGKIINFRTVRNVQSHLRGNVFVEYSDKKSALRAFINLQGRYYAAKRLNVEFSNIRTWRGAICGLSLTRKCPKGQHCSYLHLFRNPENKYNTTLEKTKTPTVQSTTTVAALSETPSLSWNDSNTFSRNMATSSHWRWSESPELELNSRKTEEVRGERPSPEYKKSSEKAKRKDQSHAHRHHKKRKKKHERDSHKKRKHSKKHGNKNKNK